MESSRRKASLAHERVMFTLAAFHLVIPVAALSSGYLFELLTFSVCGVVFMLCWIYWQNKQQQDEWVNHHWEIAWKRCRVLLFSYLISLSIILVGYCLGRLQVDPKMAGIFIVVFSRIAVVPTLLTVLYLFVLETIALSQAKQGKRIEHMVRP